MSQNAGRIDRGGNDVQKSGPGEMTMDQKKRYLVAGAGTQPIPAEAILSGIIVRTGPVGAYADTFPSADALIAACPGFDVGDSFEFLLDNSGQAFANTPTAGVGVTLVNSGVLASLVKRYMATCLAAGRSVILQATLANASAVGSLVATGVTANAAMKLAQQLQPGMLVTGTNVPASTTVLGVNTSTGSFTMSAAATGSGVSALTFSPSVEIRGLYQAAA